MRTPPNSKFSIVQMSLLGYRQTKGTLAAQLILDLQHLTHWRGKRTSGILQDMKRISFRRVTKYFDLFDHRLNFQQPQIRHFLWKWIHLSASMCIWLWIGFGNQLGLIMKAGQASLIALVQQFGETCKQFERHTSNGGRCVLISDKSFIRIQMDRKYLNMIMKISELTSINLFNDHRHWQVSRWCSNIGSREFQYWDKDFLNR